MEFVIANMAPLMFGALVLFLLFGYPVAFALAANGQAGVEHMLRLIEAEMRVAMTLTGVTSIAQIDRSILARP